MMFFIYILLAAALIAVLSGHVSLASILAIAAFLCFAFAPISLALFTQMGAPAWFLSATTAVGELGWAVSMSMGAGLAFLISPDTVTAYVQELGELAADAASAVGEVVGNFASSIVSSSGFLSLLLVAAGVYFVSRGDGQHA
jgi:hypothetical protein